MKRLVKLLLIVALLSPAFTACSIKEDGVCRPGTQAEHKSITKELVLLVEQNSELRSLLIKSIEKAATVNPDKNTNPVQSLEEFYEYIDWASTALPWNALPGVVDSFPSLFDQIDQSLCYFYFITDQPLEELVDKGYYNNSLQYHEPYRSWMIRFTKNWGAYLSTPESWNDDYYQAVLKNEAFGLQKGWYEDSSHWKSFNDFFCRHLSSPSVRPIAAADDDSVVTAPADSVPQGVWKIDANSNVESDVAIKSALFNSVRVLIGEDSNYKDAFAGGTLTHTFLNVHDYHRYHFPVGGTIREVRTIQRDDAAGGITYWDEKLGRYMLDAAEFGWQTIETRGCVILETDNYGLVALLPVGMSQISSVNFEENIRPGATVKKGDMLGYFLFGGSDIVMVFQADAGFEMTVERDGDGYMHVLMGECYGKLNGGDKKPEE